MPVEGDAFGAYESAGNGHPASVKASSRFESGRGDVGPVNPFSWQQPSGRSRFSYPKEEQ